MSKPAVRDRLAEAAFTLFDERGYEQTTVDDITERAGTGRTTFFRYYRSKEDVIFPDHDRLLEQIKERLATSSHRTALAAVSDAVRLVLLHYLDEGDLARRRYGLTSKVAALRDREIASVARYQRLFREFISDWMGDPTESASLRAELMAAAVVAAHNHVLRRWLRGESPDPGAEVDEAMRQVIDLFTAPAARGSQAGTAGDGTTVVAFRTGQDLDELVPVLRRLTEETPESLPERAPVAGVCRQRFGWPRPVVGQQGRIDRCGLLICCQGAVDRRKRTWGRGHQSDEGELHATHAFPAGVARPGGIRTRISVPGRDGMDRSDLDRVRGRSCAVRRLRRRPRPFRPLSSPLVHVSRLSEGHAGRRRLVSRPHAGVAPDASRCARERQTTGLKPREAGSPNAQEPRSSGRHGRKVVGVGSVGTR